MRFTKMHGAGNDFILINNMVECIPLEQVPELARRLCRTHLSVGADGLMLVTAPVAGGDYGMLFYNSDGSLGEMCGNGARCICRYGYDHGLTGELQRVDTTAGRVTGRRIDSSRYCVRLPDPENLRLSVPVEVEGQSYDCTYVELGNPGIPHAVVLMPQWQSIARARLFSLGAALRAAAEFPKGANVTFVAPVGENSVEAITFERGVEDFTLACGTGSGATALTLIRRGIMPGPRIDVNMPGGLLSVELDGQALYLTGPTEVSFEGELI